MSHTKKTGAPGVDHNSSKEISVTTSAPGKVILHGEHSVVYGKLAIAASLGLRTSLNLVEVPGAEPQTVTFIFKDLNLIQSYETKALQKLLDAPLPLLGKAKSPSWTNPEDINHEEHLKRIESFVTSLAVETKCELSSSEQLSLVSILYLYTAILTIFKVNCLPVTITVGTELTISAGLGSSASFLVTSTAAFWQYCRIKCNLPSQHLVKEDLELISRWGFFAEKIVHGTPSGIDNTICTFGSMVGFRKGGTFESIGHPKDFKILLINTKVPKSTKALVAKVANLRENYPDVVNPIFDSLEAVAIGARDLLGKLHGLNENGIFEGEEVDLIFKKIGEITDVNQSLLKALGASHKSIDLICSLMTHYNLHCKLTGAGGGGYCITVIPPNYKQTSLQEIIEKLEGYGFGAILVNVGGPGVQLH